LGVELLNDKELQFGSVLIDLEFEKISLGLFKNLALVYSITFPMGINHITKDISKVCSLNLDESKNIINNIDFSFQNNQNIFDENNYLKSTYFVNSSFRKISKDLILNVIKARLDEIIDTLNKQLIAPGFNLTSGISFVLKGGLNLHNIEKYFINFFGPNLKRIEKNNIEKDKDFEENFDSCLGAIEIIKDGWETEAIPETSGKAIEKIGFFSRIFGAH